MTSESVFNRIKLITHQEQVINRPRYAETGHKSFFGDYLYEQIVPSDHFLYHLKQIVGWDRFTHRLLKLYKGQGVYGQPTFDPALVLKMALVMSLSNLSEGQLEVYVNANLPAEFFVGLAVDQKAPDHSTITAFRQRLLTRNKLALFE